MGMQERGANVTAPSRYLTRMEGLRRRLKILAYALRAITTREGAIFIVRPGAEKPVVGMVTLRGSANVHRMGHLVVELGAKMCNDSATMRAAEQANAEVRP